MIAAELEIPAPYRKRVDTVLRSLPFRFKPGIDYDWGIGSGSLYFLRVQLKDEAQKRVLMGALFKIRGIQIFEPNAKEPPAYFERYEPLFPTQNLVEDLLPGGKGDNDTDADFDPKQIEMGMEVEAEHTPNPEIQDEIVHDHLDEDPEYYTKLKDAGLADELEEAELTAKARNALPDSDFVYPKDRRYPIHDVAHARNALTRSSGKSEEGKVKAAVYSKYPSLKKEAVDYSYLDSHLHNIKESLEKMR